EARLLALIGLLRQDLLARLEQLAATGEDVIDEPDPVSTDPRRPEPAPSLADPRWTDERHAVHGALHAHLELEYPHLGKLVRARPILRDLAHARAVSLDEVIARMGARPLLVAPPTSTEQTADGEQPIAAGIARLVRALRPTAAPVLAGEL